MAKADAGYSYKNLTATTTGLLIKGGTGKIHRVIINQPVASAVITLYDGTSTSGTKIGTITLPGTLLSQGPISAQYEVAFQVGLFIVVATGACDITIAYT